MIWLTLGLAFARPLATVGFSPADTVETLESADGALRVHYSVSGPNTTVLDDADANGLPDFVEYVANEGSAILGDYASFGFRPLVPESAFGLDLGGSPASDIYLVDFQGSSDGSFRVDECETGRCTGYMLLDNTYSSYPTWEDGLRVVLPHELFHGIQYAYLSEVPTWVSEGGATWAASLFDPVGDDLVHFADQYLASCDRPVDRPPAGISPVSYGTALFFDHLDRRHDPTLMADLLEALDPLFRASPDVDVLPVIDALLVARGDTLDAAFRDFVAANLATGSRAGGLQGHPYASDLTPPDAAASGATVDDGLRVFPYGMQYLRIQHPGGPLAIRLAGDPDDRVEWVLHPTADNAVLDSIASGTGNGEPYESDLDAGLYWVSLTSLVPGDSIPLDLCIGDPSLPCEATAAATPEPPDEEPKGCQVAPNPVGWLALLGLPFLQRRRTC